MIKRILTTLIILCLLMTTMFTTYSYAASAKENLKAVQNLLPSKTGFKWNYQGFVDYTHYTVLKSISKSTNKIVYKSEGKFISMSGDPQHNTPVNVTYTAKPGVLIQEKNAKNMFDKYNKIELIRTPLKKGTTWNQTVKNDQGKNETLKCTITATGSKYGKKTYTVKYKHTKSSYYEVRIITQNVGVTSYKRLLNNDPGPVGYDIYLPLSGPLCKRQLGNYLPELNKNLSYVGYAEYGHYGVLKCISERYYDAIYEFQGTYNDGMGTPDKFKVRYYMDYNRGTVTEMVISNNRTGKKEINSKFHNIVIMKTPLTKGSTWSHKTKFNGKEYTVKSKIVSTANSTIKIKYELQGKIPGYYDGKYFEERTFKKGLGMTQFSNMMPLSSLGDVKPTNWEEALNLLRFGYSLQ